MVSPRSIGPLYLLIMLGLCAAGGCVFQSRTDTAQTIAAKGELQPVIFHTPLFDIQGYQRFSTSSQRLTIYLEGDGAAWKNRYSLAADPTPKKAIGLSLAAVDPAANILYLARPCQYRTTTFCTPQYWSSHRYGPEITQAISQAIDQAKETHNISNITLIGYSGGGVLATLLAAQRDDVSQLITIATNLDIDRWAALHGVTPLWGSTNPCAYADTLQHIPQTHIIGEDDIVVPKAVTQSYLDQLPSHQHTTIITIPRAGHHENWPKLWPEVLPQTQPGTMKPKSLY